LNEHRAAQCVELLNGTARGLRPASVHGTAGNRDLGAWRPARSDDTRQREVLGGANSPPELAYAARVEA